MLLVAQGALSVMLLAGAGLFVLSLDRIGATQFGFDVDRLIWAQVNVTRSSGYSPTDLDALYQSMRDRVAAVPGVESAALTIGLAYTETYSTTVSLPGLDSLPGRSGVRFPFIFRVGPDYFRTMGTRILRGRPLNTADTRGPPVAVVNEEMARRVWPNEDAIGKCVLIRGIIPGCAPVVGVAERTRLSGFRDTERYLEIYLPLRPSTELLPARALIVRTAHPSRLLTPIRNALQGTTPDMPFVRVSRLQDRVDSEARSWRLGAMMFGLFGVLALVIAAVGTYSVMHYTVTQRLHEMGVRIALGAQRADILRLVLRQSMIVMTAACTCGLLLVIASGRVWSDLLFQTTAHDPAVLASAALVLLISATIASAVPAWRATRVDPVEALRAE